MLDVQCLRWGGLEYSYPELEPSRKTALFQLPRFSMRVRPFANWQLQNSKKIAESLARGPIFEKNGAEFQESRPKTNFMRFPII